MTIVAFQTPEKSAETIGRRQSRVDSTANSSTNHTSQLQQNNSITTSVPISSKKQKSLWLRTQRSSDTYYLQQQNLNVSTNLNSINRDVGNTSFRSSGLGTNSILLKRSNSSVEDFSLPTLADEGFLWCQENFKSFLFLTRLTGARLPRGSNDNVGNNDFMNDNDLDFDERQTKNIRPSKEKFLTNSFANSTILPTTNLSQPKKPTDSNSLCWKFVDKISFAVYLIWSVAYLLGCRKMVNEAGFPICTKIAVYALNVNVFCKTIAFKATVDYEAVFAALAPSLRSGVYSDVLEKKDLFKFVNFFTRYLYIIGFCGVNFLLGVGIFFYDGSDFGPNHVSTILITMACMLYPITMAYMFSPQGFILPIFISSLF